MNPIKAALIGIGGFGKAHTEIISRLTREGVLSCPAFCEPNADKSPEQKEQLEAIGARHYADYREMLKHPGLDFVVIATPIPLHKQMCIDALETGIPVLLEKPPAVAIEDLDAMIEVQRRTGRLAAVQFQNTSGKAFRLMLQQLREGLIGELKTVTAVGMWKRTQQYYDRTYWAGAIVYNGEYVLDGTLCNPFAHLVHNALLAAGAGHAAQAEPKWVQAELYKGHDIESEDTACVRVMTKNDVLVHIYTTLCNAANETPYIKVEGTAGQLHWTYENKLTYTDEQGKTENYSFGDESLLRNMYINMIQNTRGEEDELFCSLAESRSFLLTANGAFTSTGRIHPIPKEALDIRPEEDTIATTIPGIRELFSEASERGKLFSELSIPWSVPGAKVEMSGYRKLRLPMSDVLPES